MAENLFETQYDLTKKSKLKKFYDSYKVIIFSFIIILVILYGSFSYYVNSKENKRILLSENYLQAKIYLEAGDKDKAINLLKEAYIPIFLFFQKLLLPNTKFFHHTKHLCLIFCLLIIFRH